jgi:hypothetical protein
MVYNDVKMLVDGFSLVVGGQMGQEQYSKLAGRSINSI